MAVMLIGVFCTVDSRFSAVTTISCNSSLGGATCAHTVPVNAVQHPKAASTRLTQYCFVISPPLLLIGQLLQLECSTPDVHFTVDRQRAALATHSIHTS